MSVCFLFVFVLSDSWSAARIFLIRRLPKEYLLSLVAAPPKCTNIRGMLSFFYIIGFCLYLAILGQQLELEAFVRQSGDASELVQMWKVIGVSIYLSWLKYMLRRVSAVPKWGGGIFLHSLRRKLGKSNAI